MEQEYAVCCVLVQVLRTVVRTWKLVQKQSCHHDLLIPVSFAVVIGLLEIEEAGAAADEGWSVVQS